MVNPPNLPLRAGSSGPFVDWGDWLRNLYKNVQVRRLFLDEDADSHGVATGVVLPGTEVAGVDVEWSAADAAITGQLSYLMFGSFQFGPLGGAAGYANVVQLAFNVTPAGGVPEYVRTVSTRPIPLNPGQDFSFAGDISAHWLAVALSFTNFVQGTNRIWLGATNANPGNSISVTKGCLIVAELACPPGNLIVQP